jgi:predicted phage terminase large subunit-like protein
VHRDHSGRDPTKRIICASYSADLAAKHARDCRTIMESAWYKSVFPQTRLSRDKNAEMDFMTTRHGYRYTTSVGGSLTVRGASIIINDDPIKAEDAMSDLKRAAVNEWYDRTLYSRLDSKRDDVIILVMQRLHIEDLAGYVLAKEPWTILNLPAIAEVEERIQIGADQFHVRRVGDLLHAERESKADLDRVKATIGSFNWSAQYQQCPVPLEGEILKWEWFRLYDELPSPLRGDRIVQSWDTASTAGELSDYSVCMTFLDRGNEFFLLDVLRKKLIYPDLRRCVIRNAFKFGAHTVIIEDKGSGTSLIQDLRGDSGGATKPIPFQPEGDKVTRMVGQSYKIENGQVLVPQRAEWLGDLRAELMQFPYGRYDDQVDCLSQFLNWVSRKSRYRAIVMDLGV